MEQVVLNKGIGVILIALAESQEALAPLNDLREIDGCLVMKVGAIQIWPDNEVDAVDFMLKAFFEAMEFEGFSSGKYDGGDEEYYLIDARVVLYNPQGEAVRFIERGANSARSAVGDDFRPIFGVTEDLRAIRWL